MAMPAPPNTPLAPRKRTAAENLHARAEHQMASEGIKAVTVTSFVLDALVGLKATPSRKPASASSDKRRNAFEGIASEDTVKAAQDHLPMVKLEKIAYSPTVHLLNRISEAHYIHVFGEDSGFPAIIFGSRASTSPLGDYLALRIEPDYYAYLGTFDELKRICEQATTPATDPTTAANSTPANKQWSELIQVGEHKRPKSALSADGQLKSYLVALKRYRPDLWTVHAFCVEKGKIQLASLNPCGMAVSSAVPWTELNSWIAHVTLVYHAHEHRDRDIQFCSDQREFYRWDVRTNGGAGIAVSPFFVSHPPGRTTFACFDVLRLPEGDDRTDPASLDAMNKKFTKGAIDGFWKMSWQTISGRASEIELLSYLHKDGWVPGLVRPYDLRAQVPDKEQSKPEAKAEAAATESAVQNDDDRQPAAAAEDQPGAEQKGDETPALSAAQNVIHHPGNPGSVGRVKDVLHLGSIGEPLSQCRTSRQLVEVMYDLIEVHAHMVKLGVLHRDVSWYNVMCNPEHFITIHPVFNSDKVLPRPCISSILGRPDTGPCVLLADLDHSVKTTESCLPRPGEKTGTPMFISVEVAKPEGVTFVDQPLDRLRMCLAAAEQHDKEFNKAFPEGKGTFMANFDRVMQAEAQRIAKKPWVRGAPPPPKTRHAPRHDAESIYWVFLWAFARAQPLLASPDEDFTDTLNAFCAAMFEHSIGCANGEAGRSGWLDNSRIRTLFHPRLQPFSEMFSWMGTYLSVPWYLYCGAEDETKPPLMEPDHVHIAFRRLALVFLLDPDNAKALKVELDTATPRYTSALKGLSRKDPMADTKRAATGATGTRTGATATGTQESTTSLGKRKAEPTAPPAKRHLPSALVTEGDDASSGSKDEQCLDNGFCGPPLKGPVLQEHEDEDLAQPIAKPVEGTVQSPAEEDGTLYDAPKHQTRKDAEARHAMVWKDRTLWFGSGIQPGKLATIASSRR